MIEESQAYTASEPTRALTEEVCQRSNLNRAKEYLADGRVDVVDVDLEKFFDRVNHDILKLATTRNSNGFRWKPPVDSAVPESGAAKPMAFQASH